MRIHLKIKSTDKIIPFDHQPLLVGCIHKWLGWNTVHGNVALFSFSRLSNGRKINDGLKFEYGSSFFISAYDNDLIKKLIKGIQEDSSMFYGLSVMEMIIEPEPAFSNREIFHPASPILISRKVNNKVDHILYTDDRASQFLKETILTKMKETDYFDDTFEIFFERSYPQAGTKLIKYKNVENKANWCSVIIKGNEKTKHFIWNVGLGNSTGIGFGAIK